VPYKRASDKKARHKRYHKEWYERNKEKQKARNAEHRKRYRAEWNQFKSEQKCSRCGFAHPAAIDFHHIDPSPDDRKISVLTSNGQYRTARKEAEERCVPLCANCHRILHWDETHD
jgi:hypothetical protein